MGRILGAPGRASPHIFQMLLLDGLPRMTLSARPALAICLADSLMRSCAAGTSAARASPSEDGKAGTRAWKVGSKSAPHSRPRTPAAGRCPAQPVEDHTTTWLSLTSHSDAPASFHQLPVYLLEELRQRRDQPTVLVVTGVDWLGVHAGQQRVQDLLVFWERACGYLQPMRPCNYVIDSLMGPSRDQGWWQSGSMRGKQLT